MEISRWNTCHGASILMKPTEAVVTRQQCATRHLIWTKDVDDRQVIWNITMNIRTTINICEERQARHDGDWQLRSNFDVCCLDSMTSDNRKYSFYVLEKILPQFTLAMHEVEILSYIWDIYIFSDGMANWYFAKHLPFGICVSLWIYK